MSKLPLKVYDLLSSDGVTLVKATTSSPFFTIKLSAVNPSKALSNSMVRYEFLAAPALALTPILVISIFPLS